MAMDLVGDYAADCAYTGADNCTAGTTDLSPHNCSTNSATGDKLSLGVVMVVVGMRLGHGVFVGLLRDNGQGHGEHGCGYGGCCKCFDCHLAPR